MTSGRPDWTTNVSPGKSLYSANEVFWFNYNSFLLTNDAWHTIHSYVVNSGKRAHLGSIHFFSSSENPVDIAISIASDTVLYTTCYKSKHITFDPNTNPIAKANETIEIQAQVTSSNNVQIKTSIIGLLQTIEE